VSAQLGSNVDQMAAAHEKSYQSESRHSLEMIISERKKENVSFDKKDEVIEDAFDEND
jgi:hypothetical protein